MHQDTQFVFKKSSDGKVNVQRYVWSGGSQPELLKLSRTPQVLNLVKQLFETDQAEQLINQLHPKEPGDQVAFTWHQDIEIREAFDPQWKNANGGLSYVVLSTAIDPAHKDNGGLFVVPGSHKDQTNYRLKQKNPDDSVFTEYEKQAVPINMEPSDMLLMNQYVVHGSYPNQSQDSRLMFLTGYSYPGANHISYPGQRTRQIIDLNTGMLLTNKQ